MIPQAKMALVTGASRGIGRGIAIALARAGFGVVIHYLTNREAAKETVRLCQTAQTEGPPSRYLPCQADLTKTEERARLLSFVAQEYGWLDLLVNNAGIAPAVRTDLLQASEESFDQVLAVNLKGPYFLTQAVANFWISKLGELPAGRTRPKIVNISSISAFAASPDRGDYCVSKAALSMATRLFATRLAEFGISVYELRPGIIETDMTRRVKEKYDDLIARGLLPLARWGTPDDVGRAVVAIAQDQLPYSTGEAIHVDGGFHLRRL